jgi:hypothetical protein
VSRRKKAAPPAPPTSSRSRGTRRATAAPSCPTPDGSADLDIAREDAQRIVRNRTYGIVDQTLDPVDVLAAILESESGLYTEEQLNEHVLEALEDAAAEETERADAAEKREATAADATANWRKRSDELALQLVDVRRQLENVRVFKSIQRSAPLFAEGEQGYA